jgi:predicted Zn-ribbon and HTH transcriptional regulator
MGRTIDADALIEKIDDAIGNINFSSPYQNDNDAIVEGMERVADIVRDMPTADVVPVVRCKDCKYWICEEQTINGEKVVRCAVDDERWTGGNDFCSFGTKFVHGHWVEDPENETIVCSNCGQEFDLKYKDDVCWNCYAKMDGKEE